MGSASVIACGVFCVDGARVVEMGELLVLWAGAGVGDVGPVLLAARALLTARQSTNELAYYVKLAANIICSMTNAF